jgi:predicted nucleotidyltransferase component of viral defense system
MTSLNTILAERLASFEPKNENDEKRAVHEIIQELVLYSLSKTSFFENGVFHGGTALRIFFNIDRFSEDLDFSLVKPEKNFQWNPYLEQIRENMARYGCMLEVQDRSKADTAVKKAFIKDNSIGQILNFSWAFRGGTPEKVRIKLEVDTNPPSGSGTLEKGLTFPFPHTVKSEDLPSLFAGKCHALLCREYTKGRDWYDFLWYVGKKIEPNYRYLTNMIGQSGPWEAEGVKTNRLWLEDALKEKINTLNIGEVKADTVKFVNPETSIKIHNLDKNVFFFAVDTFHKNCITKDGEKLSGRGLEP